MTRAKGVAVHQKRKSRGKVNPLLRGLKQDVEPGQVESTMAEPASVGMMHDSRYWAPRLDEADRVMPVTVYDGDGKMMKVISKEELLARPTQDGAWQLNSRLFHKYSPRG